MKLRNLLLIIFIFFFLAGLSQADGNRVADKAGDRISLSNKVYNDKTEALLKKTGQTSIYYADPPDDGALQLGIAHSYTILTTGQYAGSTNATFNGKTHVTSNACVRDPGTGKEYLREVIQSDIGPAADGKLFWDQWTLSAETCTCNATNKTITADAGTPFSTGALCVGRKFTILGSAAGNNATFTVTNITTSVITVNETVVDEASIALDFATSGDLVWDFVDQANTGSGLAGYTDWRIPNRNELASIVDLGQCNPSINTTAFPSVPSDYHWSSSTDPCDNTLACLVHFSYGKIGNGYKQKAKYYVRLVRN